MQCAGEERFVLGLKLQCLCLCIISLNQHALCSHTLSQHLWLSVVRYLDAEHQSILHKSPKYKLVFSVKTLNAIVINLSPFIYQTEVEVRVDPRPIIIISFH